ncbi:cell wall elongation regulator TseB-like domain-containing protein [Enterococcus cecorum]
MHNEDAREKRINQILMIGIYIMLGVILFTSIFYLKATKSYRHARNEAIQIATQYGKLDQVDDFYWFNRKNTYFSVGGKDAKGDEKYVIIAQKGGKVQVVNQKDGYNEDEIRQIFAKVHPNQTILKTTLGFYKKHIVWEIVSKQNQYYFFDFKSGQAIENI